MKPHATTYLNPKLKEVSKKRYLKRLSTLEEHFGPDVLQHFEDKAWDFVQSQTRSNKESYLTASRSCIGKGTDQKALRSGCQQSIEFIEKQLAIMRKERKEKAGTKSVHQNKNWVSLKQLKEVQHTYRKWLRRHKVNQLRTNLTAQEFKILKYYIVASLYLDITARRNVFRTVQIWMSQKESTIPQDFNNYLWIKNRQTKKFFIRDHKTSGGIYGKEEDQIKVSPPLNRALNLYLKHQKLETGQLLFSFKDRELCTVGWGNLVKRVFAPTGKVIGSQMIRVIQSTSKDCKAAKQLALHAKEAGHSVNMHIETYVVKCT